MKQSEIKGNWGIKHRPKSLRAFIGNDDVVSALQSMLESGKLPRTIIFSGPTGSGKTTLAEILAKEINNSESFASSGAISVNCGADGGIDNIRDLLERAKFLPQGKCNVFILDEAHLLTKQAANALLVQLESKLPHNLWILCTNEPDLLLPTLKGRSACFSLEYPNQTSSMRLLAKIAKREGVFVPVNAYKELFKTIHVSCGGEPRSMLNALETISLSFWKGEKTTAPSADQIRKLVRGETPAGDKEAEIFRLIVNSRADLIAKRTNGYYWRMDAKFTTDLVKLGVALIESLEQGLECEVGGKRIENSELPRLFRIVNNLGEAAAKAYTIPSVIGTPMCYLAILKEAGK